MSMMSTYIFYNSKYIVYFDKQYNLVEKRPILSREYIGYFTSFVVDEGGNILYTTFESDGQVEETYSRGAYAFNAYYRGVRANFSWEL